MYRVKVKYLTFGLVFVRCTLEFSPAFPVLYEPTSELSSFLSLQVTSNIIAAQPKTSYKVGLQQANACVCQRNISFEYGREITAYLMMVIWRKTCRRSYLNTNPAPEYIPSVVCILQPSDRVTEVCYEQVISLFQTGTQALRELLHIGEKFEDNQAKPEQSSHGRQLTVDELFQSQSEYTLK